VDPLERLCLEFTQSLVNRSKLSSHSQLGIHIVVSNNLEDAGKRVNSRFERAAGQFVVGLLILGDVLHRVCRKTTPIIESRCTGSKLYTSGVEESDRKVSVGVGKAVCNKQK